MNPNEEMMKVLSNKVEIGTKSIYQIIVVEVQDLNKFYENLITLTNVITESTSMEQWEIKCFHIPYPYNRVLQVIIASNLFVIHVFTSVEDMFNIYNFNILK